MGSPVAAIEEFVTLTIMRHRGELPLSDRGRLEALEDQIRDLIEGARPAPRRIQNPSAAAAPPPKSDLAPGNVVVTRQAQGAGFGAPSANAATEQRQARASTTPLRLSQSDKTKLKEIEESDVAPSGYTASIKPCYLADYYTSDLTMATGTLNPTRARSADDEKLTLADEAKMLLGLPVEVKRVVSQAPGQARRVQRSKTPAARAASKTTKVIVHLLAGGFSRGELVNFDPAGGTITIREKGRAEPSQIGLPDVLAIFFGLAPGKSLTESSGQRLTVKLANDRKVTGASPDYAPGVQSMTLVPDDRRGNVDRVWIPAWAVKAIHLV